MFDRSIYSYSVLFDNRKVIAISDIRGSLPVFKKLLRKTVLSPGKGVLFLAGDLLEKGPYNLETLCYIMEFSRHPHIHSVIRNCDVIYRNVLYGTCLGFLQNILLNRPNNILHEIAQHVGQRVDKETGMATLSRELRKVFLRELAFIDRLPHVTETECFIFTYTGIQDERTYGRDMHDIMVQDLFMKEAGGLHRYIVAGHLPVSECRKNICCFNPIIDTCHHIISIDGGNEMKSAGQLNALVCEQGRFQFARSDHLKKTQIIGDILPANRTSFFVTWHEGQVRMLRDEGVCCPYRRETSGKVIHIAKEFLFYKDRELHACDLINYQIPARYGNLTKIASQTRNAVLVKKQGLMGWAPADTSASES